MIVVWIVSWIVLSLTTAVFVGTAITRAEAMELRRVPYARAAEATLATGARAAEGRPARQRPEPEVRALPAITPPPALVQHAHSWAA